MPFILLEFQRLLIVLLLLHLSPLHQHLCHQHLPLLLLLLYLHLLTPRLGLRLCLRLSLRVGVVDMQHAVVDIHVQVPSVMGIGRGVLGVPHLERGAVVAIEARRRPVVAIETRVPANLLALLLPRLVCTRHAGGTQWVLVSHRQGQGSARQVQVI